MVLALWAANAHAQGTQGSLYTGFLTGHVGFAGGGDVNDGSLTLGASVAVLENSSGWGAELDLGHTREFDDRFDESNVTSWMINAIGAYPGVHFRPFGEVGAGVLRVKVQSAPATDAPSRTDWAFNVGGGLMYAFNDVLAVRGDVRYFRYFQQEDLLPILHNDRFDYWRTSFGLTYTWPIK